MGRFLFAVLLGSSVGLVVSLLLASPPPLRCTDSHYHGPDAFGFHEGDITSTYCERRWLP